VRRILILFVLQHFYFISLAYNGIQIKSESNLNWMAIWVSFFFGLAFTLLVRYLNKCSKQTDIRSDPAIPISGWVFVLGASLVVHIIFQTYTFSNEHYYLRSTWQFLNSIGGVRLQFVFIFEMLLSLLTIAGAFALLYWFWGRRDIFPTLFISYAGIILAAQCIILVMIYFVHLPVGMDNIHNDALINLFRMFIYSLVWIIFVYRSKQVKQTFVYPLSE